MTHHLFIFGFGFTASALAKALASADFKISATSRTSDGADKVSALGHQGYVLSDDKPPSDELKTALASATHVLSSVPPGPTGDSVLTPLRDDIARASHLNWLGYLSTIGVYGDHKGAWVDEATPATPHSARSKRRLNAEQAWQQLATQCHVPLSIFRLAGIYGPGRSAIERVKSGSARLIIKPGQVFNRIHVDDAAAIIAANLHAPERSGIYNLTDDLPAPPEDVLAYAAKLLEAPPPPRVPIEDADLSPMAQSFYSENKRVRNQRIKDDLGVQLQYPTFKHGLEAIAGPGTSDQ